MSKSHFLGLLIGASLSFKLVTAAGTPSDQPQIRSTQMSNLSQEGNLTEGSVWKWLKKEQLVNRRLFEREGCLNLIERKDLSGLVAGQIFFVDYDPQCISPAFSPQERLVYVIKVFKGTSQKELEAGERELRNLTLLKNDPRIRALGKIRDPRLPQITFDESLYKYQGPGNSLHIMSLIHAAKGTNFSDYFKKYQTARSSSDQKKVLKEAKGAYRKLGEVLANFHLRFFQGERCIFTGGPSLEPCLTVVQGDLHTRNIFFDGKFIYFIDNERMAWSLANPVPNTQDTSSLFAIPLIYWKSYKNPQDVFFFTTTYKSFLKGYLSSFRQYPPQVVSEMRFKIKKALLQEMKRLMNSPKVKIPLNNQLYFLSIASQMFEPRKIKLRTST